MNLAYTTIVFQLVMLLNTSHAQNIATFRKTYWGMTKAEVIKSEVGRTPTSNKSGRIEYSNVNLGAVKCKLFYELNNNELAKAQYYYRPKNKEQHVAITLYMETNESLIRRYGQPIDRRETSLDSFEMSPENKVSISIINGGFVKFIEAWQTPSTLIVLSFWEPPSNQPGEDVMMLDYYSKFAKPKEYKKK